jgi:uncharacterized membrane protein YfcA
LNNLIFLLVGLARGFIDSALGMGYGVTSASLLVTFGVVPAVASASVHTAEPFVSLAAVLTFGFTLGFGSFLWNITIPMIIGGFILTPIAGWLAKKTPRRTLGILIGLWLIILNVYGLMV